MNQLIQQGKILYWGTSEWSAEQIREAYQVAQQYNLIGPSVEQPQYNMLFRNRVENEYSSLYQDVGMGLTTYSPLRSEILTGKYLDGVPDDSRLNLPGYEWLREMLLSKQGLKNQESLKKLQPIATELDISLTNLAIIWCAKNTNVLSVILGASKISQLQSNLRAVTDYDKVTDEIMSNINEILDTSVQ